MSSRNVSPTAAIAIGIFVVGVAWTVLTGEWFHWVPISAAIFVAAFLVDKK